MGLISKLEHKLQRAVTDKVTEKIITNGAEGAVNSAVKMLGKVTGQKTAPEYIKKAEKQILVVKSKSYSLKTLTHTFKRLAKGKLPNFGANQSRYLVVDRTGELKYRSDDTGDALDRTITNVYDSAGARIGGPSQKLCKPPRGCRIEAPQWRFRLWEEETAARKNKSAGQRFGSCYN